MFKKINKILILVLLLSIVFSSFAFADALYPHVNTVTQSDGSPYPYSIVLFSSNSGYNLFVGTEPFVVKSYGSSGILVLFSNGPFKTYKVNSDNSEWSYNKGFSNGGTTSVNFTSLLHSSHNVLFEDGTVFFSNTTTPLVQVVKEETEIMMTDLVGKTLTILQAGFGVLSVMLSVMLLIRFFRFYQHRLI